MASRSHPLRMLAAAALVALAAGGCLKRGPADDTGSTRPVEAGRRDAQAWAARFEANPSDGAAAIGYAAALRQSDQHAQAVAVLQQAAIRNPKDLPLMAAYGKALADTGRYKEASEVLGRAHLPEKPDWRILSAQGAVADQLGDHALAQRYYEAALKIAPGEPTVLSNRPVLRVLEAPRRRREDAESRRRDAGGRRSRAPEPRPRARARGQVRRRRGGAPPRPPAGRGRREPHHPEDHGGPAEQLEGDQERRGQEAGEGNEGPRRRGEAGGVDAYGIDPSAGPAHGASHSSFAASRIRDT